jgi:GTP-binding protein
VCNDIVQAIGWQGPVYQVSAYTGAGKEHLVNDIMAYLETQQQESA